MQSITFFNMLIGGRKDVTFFSMYLGGEVL